MDEVRFVYRLTGHGWAEADFQLGGQAARLTASYIGDALGDLLRGTLALARGAEQVEVSWAEEPGEFRWRLSARDDASLDVRILRLGRRAEETPPGMPLDPGHEVLAGRCDSHDFFTAITKGATDILNEYGLDGYRERWDQFDFPSETLTDLSALG